LGQFADYVINMGPNHDLEEKMKTRITDEELDTMKACGMENGDGFIDASEFVILILVRIHAVNPELISVIEERFAELDADNSGNLSYEELTLRTTQILGSNNHRLTFANDMYRVVEV
jgi:Ca2+-binding EF-hand superfamily protein